MRVIQAVQEYRKFLAFTIRHFKCNQHASKISTMIPIVKETDVPSTPKPIQKLHQGSWPFGKLEPTQCLVNHIRGSTSNHVPDMQFRNLIIREIDGLVPLLVQLLR